MKYPTANIIYKGLEDKGLTVNVVDEKGKKWKVWKKEKGSSDFTDVYATLKSFEFGERFGVTYGEKEESFIGKEGSPISYTSKTIYSILPVVTSPTTQETAPSEEIPPLPEAEYISDPKPQDKFGTRLAIHGFVNARLHNHTIQQVKAELDELLALEEFINFKLS